MISFIVDLRLGRVSSHWSGSLAIKFKRFEFAVLTVWTLLVDVPCDYSPHYWWVLLKIGV